MALASYAALQRAARSKAEAQNKDALLHRASRKAMVGQHPTGALHMHFHVGCLVQTVEQSSDKVRAEQSAPSDLAKQRVQHPVMAAET